MKTRGRKPDIVLRNGKPAAVILDIEEYEDLLERVEDVSDLEALRAMRNKPLGFKKLEDFLNEPDRRA